MALSASGDRLDYQIPMTISMDEKTTTITKNYSLNNFNDGDLNFFFFNNYVEQRRRDQS